MKVNNTRSLKNYIAIASCSSALLLYSSASNAGFIYEYTGNIFSVEANSFSYDGPDGPGFYPEYYDTFLTLKINTATLFKNGNTLTNDMTISMTGGINPYSYVAELIYPVFPDPYPEYTPRIGAGLNINAVDVFGIPTDWAITVVSYIFQGGRGQAIEFASSTNLDTIYGYDEPFYEYFGSLINNPGTWKVTEEVSEPTS